MYIFSPFNNEKTKRVWQPNKISRFFDSLKLAVFTHQYLVFLSFSNTFLKKLMYFLEVSFVEHILISESPWTRKDRRIFSTVIIDHKKKKQFKKINTIVNLIHSSLHWLVLIVIFRAHLVIIYFLHTRFYFSMIIKRVFKCSKTQE